MLSMLTLLLLYKLTILSRRNILQLHGVTTEKSAECKDASEFPYIHIHFIYCLPSRNKIKRMYYVEGMSVYDLFSGII
jgi:hypothetical protein